MVRFLSIVVFLPMSSSVACWATTQNRMTNCSFTEAGTMWSFPEALMVLSSFWFSSSLPFNLKQTRANCKQKKWFSGIEFSAQKGNDFNSIEMVILSLNTFTSLQTTNRLSCKQYVSKTLANRQCSLIYACKPVIP